MGKKRTLYVYGGKSPSEAEKPQRPNQARTYVPTFPFTPSDRYKLPRRANLVSVDDALAVTHESSGGATLLMYVSFANDPFSLIFTLIMACVSCIYECYRVSMYGHCGVCVHNRSISFLLCSAQAVLCF